MTNNLSLSYLTVLSFVAFHPTCVPTYTTHRIHLLEMLTKQNLITERSRWNKHTGLNSTRQTTIYDSCNNDERASQRS